MKSSFWGRSGNLIYKKTTQNNSIKLSLESSQKYGLKIQEVVMLNSYNTISNFQRNAFSRFYNNTQ